jgi:hypothetical protein
MQNLTGFCLDPIKVQVGPPKAMLSTLIVLPEKALFAGLVSAISGYRKMMCYRLIPASTIEGIRNGAAFWMLKRSGL